MGDLWGPEARLAVRREYAAMKASRCGHGMLPGMCVIESCKNWDGVRSKTPLGIPNPKRRYRCARCSADLPGTEFYVSSSGALRSTCKACDKLAVKLRRLRKVAE